MIIWIKTCFSYQIQINANGAVTEKPVYVPFYIMIEIRAAYNTNQADTIKTKWDTIWTWLVYLR